MTRLRLQSVWLGGDRLSHDVVVVTDNGRISAILPNDDEPAQLVTGIVLPAFVTAHSHCFHRALRGRTHQATGTFWSWRDLMYQVAGDLCPDTYRQLAAGVFAEMLTAGITGVGEFHYLHHPGGEDRYPDPNAMSRALMRGAADAGIRLTLIDTCYLAGGVAGEPITSHQSRFSDGSIEAWAERVHALASVVTDEPLVKMAVAAHSVRAVPAGDLHRIREVSDELGVPLHVHMSEQVGENEACLAEHGVTPTKLLLDTGVLGPRAVAIHATHLTDDDLTLLAGSGAGVCLCPTTERDLGDGLSKAHELRQAGVDLSLGSDSNAVIDMFEEARGAELHDRLRTHTRGINSAESLLKAATRGGGLAIGQPGLGMIEAGALADFIVLDTSSYRLAGVGSDAAIAEVVFAATRDDVSEVWVSGNRVVVDGHHVGGWDAAALSGGLAAVTL